MPQLSRKVWLTFPSRDEVETPAIWRMSQAFPQVIEGCALPRDNDSDTWLTLSMQTAYIALHELGYAHIVEVWQDAELVGGVYGIAIGGLFAGESMFHRVTDASKVALVHLVRQLRRGGFVLLDTQFKTTHLARFGVVEIPRRVYEARLRRALRVPATWWPDEAPGPSDQPIRT